MDGASPEMQRAALEWAAAEAQDARRVEAAVAELQAPAPGTAPAAAPVAPAAAAEARAQLHNLLGVAWTVIDRLAQEVGGKHLALLPEEREQLVAASVPVAEKYLPADLTLPVEAVLLVTAGMVYGPKLLAGGPATPPAPEAAA